jgi:hypothetical protein
MSARDIVSESHHRMMVRPAGHSNLRTANDTFSVTPCQLFARRIIDVAFQDARRMRDGQPTETAKEALDFIEAKTNWTRYGKPVPPPEIRDEYYGTFEWACEFLNKDPDTVRATGIPPTPGMFATGGVPQIRQAWERARRAQPDPNKFHPLRW